MAAYTDILEIAFGSQPMAASPVWTDVSRWLLPDTIEVTFGRPNEFGEVTPATLSFKLDNSDGRFTQDLITSPYWPNVKLGRRVRWTRIRDGAAWQRFDGHANNFPTRWHQTDASYAVAEITATDRGKRLGRPGELRSMVEHEILRDVPTCYYPLGEAEGATAAADATGNLQPAARVTQKNAGGAVDFGAGTGPGTDSLAAPMFTPASAGSGKYLAADPLAMPMAGASLTLEAFVRCESTVTSRLICAAANSIGDNLRLSVNAGGFLQAQLVIDGAAAYTIASDAAAGSPVVNDNLTHHVAVVEFWNGGSPQASLHLDGIQVAEDIVYDRPPTLSFHRLLAGGSKGGEMMNGTVSHVAGWSANLSDATILRHANAGLNGLTGERSDVRMGRISDYAAIPTADRVYDAGDSLVGAQNLQGRDPHEVKQEVVDTENGVLFFDPKTGKETFHNRSRRYNRAPDVVLDADAYQLVEAPELPGDDFGVVNDQTVTVPGGAGARFLDQASIDEFGTYRDSKDIAAASDGDALSVAAWRVNAYGQPRTRIPNVVVDLLTLDQRAPALVPALLSATIGTRLRLQDLPDQAPGSSLDVFVEGWTETASLGHWFLAFNCSPADIWDVWQLNLPGHDELGTTTILAQGGPI